MKTTVPNGLIPSMARQARKSGEAGLTLVEVVVCLGLLGFVSAGIMSLLTIAVHQNKLAQMRSVATGLASARVQRLTSLPYQPALNYANYRLPEEVAAAGPPQTLTADFGTIPSYPEYRRVVTLTYDVPVAGMLRVESRVFWNDLNQGVKSHVMVTYLHPGSGGRTMRGLMRNVFRGSNARGATGFSLIEVMVALGIFVFVLGIVFVFFVDYSRSLNSETSIVDMQMTARVALDEIARNVQQTGYNIDRTNTNNPTRWQHDLIHAGSHVLAFNADVDDSVGPIDATQTLTFPTGETYLGEGPPSSTDGAETFVYTIDADGNDSITTADRTDAAIGTYNPAAETPNPLDFALFKRVHGWDGSSYGGALVPIAPNLFTNATTDSKYPDNTTPRPVFEYLLTEDLDGNRGLADSECVVEPCPPSSSRLPVQYRWGDTDFDGVLSESEKTFIRDKPVGSPAWSKNPLVASGAYKSTTLTSAVDPMATDAYILHVADATKLGPGVYVQIGTGGTAETNMIDSIVPSSNTAILLADPERAHASGVTVTILSQTLLRAVRAVQIDFDAITPKKSSEGGVAAPGTVGHVGTRGLDYRVKQFEKTVELINLQTKPLVGVTGTAPPTCPLTLTGVCGGSPITVVTTFVPAAAPVPLGFVVKDSSNATVEGVPVDFSLSNGSLGSFGGATSVKSDASGLASAMYTPSGSIGDNVLTAEGTCADASDNLVYFTSTVTAKNTRVEIQMNQDCMGTVGGGVSTSSSDFTIQVMDSSGMLTDMPLLVSLTVDPASLPSPPDFTKVEGELYLSGTSIGTTGSSGILPAVSVDTGPSGILSGRVALIRDVDGEGVQLKLMVTPVGGLCYPSGATVAKTVTYYKLGLSSIFPKVGCTEVTPCPIPAGSLSPAVAARLSLAGNPVPNASVDFTSVDFQPAPPAVSPGASIFVPDPTRTTDPSGLALVYVSNNGSPSITISNPLQTTVSATSSGDPAACFSGNIEASGLKPQFIFEGPVEVGVCEAEVQPSWISLVGGKTDQVCMNVLNPVSTRACSQRILGLKVTVFQLDGITPDPTFEIKTITGGTVASSPSCSNADKVPLYDLKCNANLKLASGTLWEFQTVDKCRPAPFTTDPGEFFIFDNIRFTLPVKGTKRRIDVILVFECGGLCSLIPNVKTFSFIAPDF